MIVDTMNYEEVVKHLWDKVPSPQGLAHFTFNNFRRPLIKKRYPLGYIFNTVYHKVVENIEYIALFIANKHKYVDVILYAKFFYRGNYQIVALGTTRAVWYTNHYRERLLERLADINYSTTEFLKLITQISCNPNNDWELMPNDVFYQTEEGYHIVNVTTKILFHITFVKEYRESQINKLIHQNVINQGSSGLSLEMYSLSPNPQCTIKLR